MTISIKQFEILFKIYLTQQNSQRWYLLERTSRRFLWCWLLLLFFYLTGGFSFHCFSTSSLTLPGFTPILCFQPSPSQSDSRHFHFHPFRYLLTASATVLSGRFLPTSVFYLMLLCLWLRWGQEHPIQDLPLCLPSQSCPFRLTHSLELLMFELQDHWFINCPSEPRSIEAKLNYWICFASSKSYEKTIKALWTRLDVPLQLNLPKVIKITNFLTCSK